MVLRNVLHSYAVADRETGYCQGLSFVTGILLMHVRECCVCVCVCVCVWWVGVEWDLAKTVRDLLDFPPYRVTQRKVPLNYSTSS